MRTLRLSVALAALFALLLPSVVAQDAAAAGGAAERTDPWPDEVVELAARLPVQDGGRVKPLSSLAGFKMLKLHGSRTMRLESGKLSPTEWVLDCLFFPEQAETYPTFRVDYDRVLSAIGVESRKKRDRYSYEELAPGRSKLMQEARRIQAIDPKARDIVETQLFKLANDFLDFENLTAQLAFARHEYTVGATPAVGAMFPEETTSSLATILGKASELRGLILAEDADRMAVQGLLQDVEFFAGRSDLAFFPPSLSVEDQLEWDGVDDLVLHAFQQDAPVERQIEMLAALERMEATKTDPAAFKGAIEDLYTGVGEVAEARGEFWRVGLEVKYYDWDFFYRSLYLFVLAFLLLAVTWLVPGARWANVGAWLATGGATLLLVAGITVRCFLLGRAPVSTLYETILFITAITVLVSLAIEWINRQRIGIAMAAFLGALGMWLSTRYEFKDAVDGDTLKSLVAVLRTNFWLSTHVTTVTMGYAAGLLAAALAHVYIFGRMLGRLKDPARRKSLSRMIYGVICFGLLFSVVGTILGGIWANDSWGRFWGWDPKENGALMICLAMLFILHARLGGYIRELGLAVLSIVTGAIVVFSWWHVNLLGVGLHSYGFTDGLRTTLLVFYSVEGAVLAGTGLWWLYQRGKTAALRDTRGAVLADES